LERDGFNDLFGKPVSTFPAHALAGDESNAESDQDGGCAFLQQIAPRQRLARETFVALRGGAGARSRPRAGRNFAALAPKVRPSGDRPFLSGTVSQA